jgi:hypothetical protein
LTTTDDVQRRGARAIGAAYLAALPLAVFSEFYVGSRINAATDVSAHERLFRLGLAATVAVSCVDMVLIAGLYVVLRRVGYMRAVTAAIMRIIETTLLLMVAIADLAALRMSVTALGSSQLLDLALTMHGQIYAVALLLAGVGSTLFGLLWYQSRLIPRQLAAWGVGAALLLAGREAIWLFDPVAARSIPVAAYGGPIFIFELVTGVWLLARGLARTSAR